VSSLAAVACLSRACRFTSVLAALLLNKLGWLVRMCSILYRVHMLT